MSFPKDLLYTKDHEWAKIEGDTALIGITDHAQNSLGEIVYAELPKVGRELKSHETFGVVESIKAVSDLYCPLAGQVLAVNETVSGNPGLVNSSPYADGWLIKVRISDKGSLATLMSPADYEKFVGSLR